jgi:hypothetical protein
MLDRPVKPGDDTGMEPDWRPGSWWTETPVTLLPAHRRERIAAMKSFIALLAVAAFALTAAPAEAKGCLKGAAVGGVAGHYAGHHGWLGAAAGCLYGRHRARQQEQQQQTQHQGQAGNSTQTGM